MWRHVEIGTFSPLRRRGLLALLRVCMGHLPFRKGHSRDGLILGEGGPTCHYRHVREKQTFRGCETGDR